MKKISLSKFTPLLLLLVCLYSCKTVKNSAPSDYEIKNISDAKLIKSIESNYLSYNNIYIKKYSADISINGSRKSFSGSLFMQRDSHVIMTVAPLLGIELFRAKLASDSVYLIDRTKKSVYSGSYGLIEKLAHLDVNFQTVQAILSDELFTVDESLKDGSFNKKFKHHISQNRYNLANVKQLIINKNGQTTNIIQNFQIMPQVFKVSESSVKNLTNGNSLQILYLDMLDVNGVQFPSKIKISGFRGGKKVEANLLFHSVDVNSKNTIQFQIPSKYNRLKL